ncbi:hypothetical protein ANCDUO_07158 [Ancylostoma duodenale]|uniref:Uncharacterized protein n=1 Tax=Ancylostoma duodenale TaxID=51022 RepID=A0A0C2CZR9_9BILA|nr:hypothetical protein ANCDUO_07158 [Ancylostoma duodenale]
MFSGATVEEDLPTNITRLDLDALEDIAQRKDQILDNTLETKTKDGPVRDVELPNFEPWRSKRAQILSEHETSDKTGTYSTFGSSSPAKFSMSSKTRHRLEVLEDMSGLRKLSDISQNEFVTNVNNLREQFLAAWEDNKRIEAVRIMTDLARLLSAPTTPCFFPIQWVLVTDILDLFGKLVYERILSKANEERQAIGYSPLTNNFVSDDILPDTTELAQNWFCKIADIKEAVPRFYVFSHPLSAAYARAYICKIAMILEPTDRGPHWKALNDWMQAPKQPTEYVAPALEWVVQCVSYGAATIEDLGPLWEYCKQSEQRGLLLHAFVLSIPLKYLLNHCLEVCEITNYCVQIVSQGRPAEDFEVFGTRLLQGETPEEVRPQILRYFSVKHLQDLCELTLEKIRKVQNPNEHFSSLAAIVGNVMSCRTEDLSTVLKMKPFVDILDYVRDEPYGSRCAKAVLTSIIHAFPVESVNDLIIVDRSFITRVKVAVLQIVEQCSRLCLSIRPDSIHDEVRVVDRIVSSALDRPMMSEDPERHLAFLVRARSNLYQSDDIIAHILTLMVSFAFQFYKDRQASNKKATFMRALIANLFITIPSINDPVVRLHFALRAVYLSLLANSRPQTEAMLTYSVQTMDDLEVPPAQCLSLYSEFLAILVFVPDKSEKHVLPFYNAFVQFIQRKKWPPKHEGFLGDVWILCLRYLWAVSQREFSTKFTNVQSNDVFHGSSKEYMLVKEHSAGSVDSLERKNRIFSAAVTKNVDFAMQQLLSLIEAQPAAKPTVALHLLEFAVMKLEIRGPVVNLVSNLLKRCAKSGQFEVRVRCVIDDLINLSETNEESSFGIAGFNYYVRSVASRMFSDEEDFPEELSDIEDSEELVEKVSNGAEFHKLMQKRAQIEKRMNDVDELARQAFVELNVARGLRSASLRQRWHLPRSAPKHGSNCSSPAAAGGQVKFAMELRKGMSDCYSNRAASFPIETNLELRRLASGSLLVLFSIRNKTSYDLIGWSISASFVPPASDDSSSFSQSIALDSLAPGEEFSSELFAAQQRIRLPLIVHLRLAKCFNIAGEQKHILIELDREYLSLRDLIYPVNATLQPPVNGNRSSVIGSFSLRIPCALVDLLAGCPDDNDPVNVLRILLPRHHFRSLSPGTLSTDALLVMNPSQKHPLHFDVTKEATHFVVSISLRDATLRTKLKEALQLYLIHMSLRL